MTKRFSIRSGMVVVLLVSIFFVLGTWQGTGFGGSGDGKFLADRHQQKGSTCASCHKETPPKALVPMEVCLGCHGSYTKITQKTIKTEPNPHASHMGELACESCHHAHKPSENQCAACHPFVFKVP